jgi:hypothetical protein
MSPKSMYSAGGFRNYLDKDRYLVAHFRPMQPITEVRIGFGGIVHRCSTVFLRLRFSARRILAIQLHLSLGS